MFPLTYLLVREMASKVCIIRDTTAQVGSNLGQIGRKPPFSPFLAMSDL